MIEIAPPPGRDVDRRDVEDLVYNAALLLDEKDFKGWLDLCAEEFTYAIRTFSPEIRKEMAWLDLDREGMLTLIKHLPRHNTDQSDFTRQTTVYGVTFPGGTNPPIATATSAVAIHRTTLDGGATALFAVGKYHDTLKRTESGWLFVSRELRLVTRNLGIGTHYPL